MSFDYTKAFEIQDDGLVFENGVHVISGITSPQGAINPSNPTRYFQTDGSIWYHSGTGGISAWTLLSTGGNSQIDGGNASSNYGGTATIDGGGA